MSAKTKFNYDTTKFKAGQREAALALVEYEFTPKKGTEDGTQRKTKQQIADEIGVTRKTLHNWEFHDPNFIAYKNYLASEFMDSHLAFVYRKLLDGIAQGSMRGVETFLKRIGDMDTNSDITIHQGAGDNQTFEERKAAILERLGESDKDSNSE